MSQGVAPLVPDVSLCNRNADATEDSADSAAPAVEVPGVLPRVLAAPDDTTAGALTAALDQFTGVKQWGAVQETLQTVAVLFAGNWTVPLEQCKDNWTAAADWPVPPGLVKAGVRAIAAHIASTHECEHERLEGCSVEHDCDPDQHALWKYAVMLARKDDGDACFDELCSVWARIVNCLSMQLDEPPTQDLAALDAVIHGLYRHWDQPKSHSAAVTRALVKAGALTSAAHLLRRHGLCCAGYSNSILTTFWEMANRLDDVNFAALVTEHDGYFQRLQDAVDRSHRLNAPDWPIRTSATRKRIAKLGLEWSVPAAAVAASLSAAVARAERAEAEIARRDAAMRQSPHDTCPAARASLAAKPCETAATARYAD